MKKMVMVLLCVLMLSALGIGNAVAVTPPWYNCNIDATGAIGPWYFVFATSPGNWTGSQQFILDATDPQMKAVFASLLTAKANMTDAAIYAPSGVAPNSFITGATVGPQP
jgi:hypothetical protein